MLAFYKADFNLKSSFALLPGNIPLPLENVLLKNTSSNLFCGGYKSSPQAPGTTVVAVCVLWSGHIGCIEYQKSPRCCWITCMYILKLAFAHFLSGYTELCSVRRVTLDDNYYLLNSEEFVVVAYIFLV